MARPARLGFPNALYHVSSREDRRKKIYEDIEGRERFLEILGSHQLGCYRSLAGKGEGRWVTTGAWSWKGLRSNPVSGRI